MINTQPVKRNAKKAYKYTLKTTGHATPITGKQLPPERIIETLEP